MGRQCSLKESFIEKQLDKYQPKWREGEDITAETKQMIREYVVEKLPEDLKEDVTCITDYSIWNMAQKIRAREGLPMPKKTNKGKVSKHEPSKSGTNKVGKNKPDKSPCVDSQQKNETEAHNAKEQEPEQVKPECTFTVMDAVRELIRKFSMAEIKHAINTIEQERVGV